MDKRKKIQNSGKESTIVANHLKGNAYLRSISVGLLEGNTIKVLNKTPLEDYVVVEVHKKIFAVPKWMMEKLEVRP